MFAISSLFTSQNFILAGVAASLAGSLARAVWTKPAQRAQINAIEAKVDLVLNQVSQVLPSVQSAARASNRAAAASSDLSLGLAPIIKAAAAPVAAAPVAAAPVAAAPVDAAPVAAAPVDAAPVDAAPVDAASDPATLPSLTIAQGGA